MPMPRFIFKLQKAQINNTERRQKKKSYLQINKDKNYIQARKQWNEIFKVFRKKNTNLECSIQ